jgi:thiosulfate dehydrogenase [quinone] large subunit
MARNTVARGDSTGSNAARSRRIVALVAALIGGYLLTVATEPTNSARVSIAALIIGTILFVAILWYLQRTYHPGLDEVTEDEVGRASEWKVARFMRRAREAAPLFLGLRLFLAFEWISGGWGKLQNDAWMSGGTALQGFWQRAATVPNPPANPVITYPAYRSFIQFMLDHEWYTWFAKVIAIGELLIGIGLLVGGLTAIAAVFGLLMNFSFIYAGSTSSNPTLIILGALIVFGWRVAGWWGLDRFLLPLLGTPWETRQRRQRLETQRQL